MVVSPIIIEFNLSNKLYFDSVVLDLPGLPMKGHVHLLEASFTVYSDEFACLYTMLYNCCNLFTFPETLSPS